MDISLATPTEELIGDRVYDTRIIDAIRINTGDVQIG